MGKSLGSKMAMSWFGIVTICLLPPFALLCKMCHFLPVEPIKKHRAAGWFACLLFRLLIILSPWIKIGHKFGLERWPELCGGEKPVMLIVNHQSFFDTMLICSLFSKYGTMNFRTFMAAKLYGIPFLGMILRAVGHFPVYYNSDKQGDFKVDREQQAAVAARSEQYLNEGGGLALFPEGTMNPDQKTGPMQNFRHGSFKMAIQHKMPIVGLAIAGCEDVWPRKAAIGGFPATVAMSLIPIKMEWGDETQEDAASIAGNAQSLMQAEVDKVYGCIYGAKKTD